MRTKLVLALALVLFLAFTAEMCPSKLTPEEQYVLDAYKVWQASGIVYNAAHAIIEDLYKQGKITEAQYLAFHPYDNNFRKYYQLYGQVLGAFVLAGMKDKTALENAKLDLDKAITEYNINKPKGE